jgi:hypothetical protein
MRRHHHGWHHRPRLRGICHRRDFAATRALRTGARRAFCCFLDAGDQAPPRRPGTLAAELHSANDRSPARRPAGCARSPAPRKQRRASSAHRKRGPASSLRLSQSRQPSAAEETRLLVAAFSAPAFSAPATEGCSIGPLSPAIGRARLPLFSRRRRSSARFVNELLGNPLISLKPSAGGTRSGDDRRRQESRRRAAGDRAALQRLGALAAAFSAPSARARSSRRGAK